MRVWLGAFCPCLSLRLSVFFRLHAKRDEEELQNSDGGGPVRGTQERTI